MAPRCYINCVKSALHLCIRDVLRLCSSDMRILRWLSLSIGLQNQQQLALSIYQRRLPSRAVRRVRPRRQPMSGWLQATGRSVPFSVKQARNAECWDALRRLPPSALGGRARYASNRRASLFAINITAGQRACKLLGHSLCRAPGMSWRDKVHRARLASGDSLGPTQCAFFGLMKTPAFSAPAHLTSSPSTFCRRPVRQGSSVPGN